MREKTKVLDSQKMRFLILNLSNGVGGIIEVEAVPLYFTTLKLSIINKFGETELKLKWNDNVK